MWADSYPRLHPQKVVIGSDSGCVSCIIICTAFQSVGLDLRTSHDIQSLWLSRKDEEGKLTAAAALNEGLIIWVEFYTVQGEFLTLTLMSY